MTATVEYAVAVLGVHDVVICGHSDCGAMTAIAKGHDHSHLPAVCHWLRHADATTLVRNNSFPPSNPRRLSMPMPDWNSSSYRRGAMTVGFTRSGSRAVQASLIRLRTRARVPSPRAMWAGIGLKHPVTRTV
jgi:hypothetical protein